jgi:hypothetical protein
MAAVPSTCPSCQAIRQALAALPAGTVLCCSRCGRAFTAPGARGRAAPATWPVPPPASPAGPTRQPLLLWGLIGGSAALLLVLALVGAMRSFTHIHRPGE